MEVALKKKTLACKWANINLVSLHLQADREEMLSLSRLPHALYGTANTQRNCEWPFKLLRLFDMEQPGKTYHAVGKPKNGRQPVSPQGGCG